MQHMSDQAAIEHISSQLAMEHVNGRLERLNVLRKGVSSSLLPSVATVCPSYFILCALVQVSCT